jgi:hypothetical protein
VGALVLTPWAGATRAPHDAIAFVDSDEPLLVPPAPAPALGAPLIAPFVPLRATTTDGCGCDTVVINASNELHEVKVRTGNARAVNNAVTYISGGYAATYEHEIDVKIRQVARAISGDAFAGQQVGLDAPGPRCHNILVRARNIMDDVQVRSGNATAINHSTVLLDPGVDATRLDIRLRQHAIAAAGNATAGQVIGTTSSGGGGCGGIRIDATNVETDVKVRVGKAVGTNDNTIQVCAQVGCAAELSALAATADQIQLCTADGCTKQAPADVAAKLAPDASPTPDATPSPDAGLVSSPAPRCPKHGRLAHLPPCAPVPSPSPSPSPDANAQSVNPLPSSTPTPSPTPSAAPIL